MVAPRHLKSLQAIELALRTGSMKAAAEALGITPAAAGQRVKALEDVLGVDLMVRGRSGLQPSAALAAAADHLAAAFRELDRVDELLDLQRAHEIVVRIESDLGRLWLTPLIGGFAAQFPNIKVRLAAPDEAVRAPDCEITARTVTPAGETDLLFRDVVDALGSPDIAGRVARQPAGLELFAFPLIHHPAYASDLAAGEWDHWGGSFGLDPARTLTGLRYPALPGAIVAARAGAGVMRCGLALVRTELERGQLVRMLDGQTRRVCDSAVHATYRPAALARPQVRRFREFLNREGAVTRAWLEQA